MDIKLTQIEFSVLALVMMGRFDREIAVILKLPENRIKAHFRQVRRKIGLNTRTKVCIWASQNPLAFDN